jgi:predicted permease
LVELLRLFANNLLPIFLAASTGYFLAHFLKVPARPLSQAAFYIFSPCLIFTLMTGSTLKGSEIGSIVLVTILSCFSIGGLAWLVSRLMKLERKFTAAVMLTSMFVNAGNYGLALVLFAFGKNTLSYASIFFVTNALLAYSFGALIASLGSASLAQSFKNLLKVPALYAMILGIIIMATGWKIPLPVERAINLLSDASIPVLMIVLGMQLKAVTWKENWLPLSLASGLRLLIAPLVGLTLSILLGLQGAARQAVILEASMPTAILTTVIATEYNLQPSFVTAVVFVTTLLSPLTLTPLLKYLGG